MTDDFPVPPRVSHAAWDEAASLVRVYVDEGPADLASEISCIASWLEVITDRWWPGRVSDPPPKSPKPPRN